MRQAPASTFVRGKAPASLAALMILGLLFSGCGSRKYSDGDIRAVEGVYHGTVIDVTDVIVEEEPSLVGPLAGGVAGGLVGSAFGAGTGRLLFTLGGAALGSAAGGGADAFKRRYRASQITMELDNGGALVVVQRNDEYFVRGDKVRIMSLGEDRASVQHE